MVEQRTHKPLVGSSNLPFGTIYIKDASIVRGVFFLCSYHDWADSHCSGPVRFAPGHVVASLLGTNLPFGTIYIKDASIVRGVFFWYLDTAT